MKTEETAKAPKDLLKRLEEFSGLKDIKVVGNCEEIRCVTLGGRELVYSRDHIPHDIQEVFRDYPSLLFNKETQQAYQSR